jgi:ribonuclease HI
MPKLSPQQLLRLIRQHLDTEGLLAAHPEVSRADIEALWARLGLDEPAAPAAHRQPGLFDPPQAPTGSKPVVARCDGAARGNPGPAAIGVVLQDPKGNALREVGERIGDTTCNVAEYRAVIRAAEEALALGATDITFLLDSELLVFQLRGSYRVKAPHLRLLHDQAMALLRRFRRWEVRHVPREQNAAADALANLALDGQC